MRGRLGGECRGRFKPCPYSGWLLPPRIETATRPVSVLCSWHDCRHKRNSETVSDARPTMPNLLRRCRHMSGQEPGRQAFPGWSLGTRRMQYFLNTVTCSLKGQSRVPRGMVALFWAGIPRLAGPLRHSGGSRNLGSIGSLGPRLRYRIHDITTESF